MPLRLLINCREDCLTTSQMARLLDGAERRRHGLRDRAILLTMFRHGLRASELCNLRLDDYLKKKSRLRVKRNKGGLSTIQPVEADEAAALNKYIKTRRGSAPWLFLTERRARLTRQAVFYIIRGAAELSSLDRPVNPQLLRHACVHYLAEKGYDYATIQLYLGRRTLISRGDDPLIQEAGGSVDSGLDNLMHLPELP